MGTGVARGALGAIPQESKTDRAFAATRHVSGPLKMRPKWTPPGKLTALSETS